LKALLRWRHSRLRHHGPILGFSCSAWLLGCPLLFGCCNVLPWCSALLTTGH
jgi:hypothetical protein